MQKNIVLLAAFLFVTASLFLNYIGTYAACGVDTHNSTLFFLVLTKFLHLDCVDTLFYSSIVLLPVFPLFLFSLITYFMREEVYKAWIKFALWALGISMVLIAITPDMPASGFGPQISFGKSDVALLTSALFVIVSIVLIVRAHLKTRK